MSSRSHAAPFVIALHGGGVDARVWALVARRMAPLELFAPNLLPLATRAESKAGRLIEMLASMIPADREVVVAGCSMGGVLACALAAKLGPRARGLLTGSTGPVVVDGRFIARISGLRDLLTGEVTAELVEANLPMMSATVGPFASQANPLARTMIGENFGPGGKPLMDLAFDMKSPHLYLDEVACPVRACFGAYDPFMTSGWIDGWRERLGRENVTVLPSSHQFPLDCPDVVAEAIRWLAGLRPGR